MFRFVPASRFKQIDQKKFDLNKYTSSYAIKYTSHYTLQQLHNDYPLAPDNVEIKKEILSNYQLKIADLYNIPTANVKKIST